MNYIKKKVLKEIYLILPQERIKTRLKLRYFEDN